MTMKKIDYEYYEWLVSQIAVPPNRTYNDLFERMHNLEFTWIVKRDNNRVQDGRDLRNEFLDGSGQKLSLDMVSILEVLIALSRRTAFTAGGSAKSWAWRLIKNLRLNKASDPLVGEKAQRVEEILYNLVWRGYDPSGVGGFFPLRDPKEDQTQIDIWYQMNAYVIERSHLSKGV